MTARLAAMMLAAALITLTCAGKALCQTGSGPLTLTFTEKHGGLKIPVLPPGKGLPKLGLAFAGGGAKAAASVGVLKVLAHEGIPVSFIAGSSMGAGVGGLFAAGYSPEEIERIFLDNDWNSLFTDAPPRALLTQEQKEASGRHLLEFTVHEGGFLPLSGLSAGQKLSNLLAIKTLAASFEAGLDFDRLQVPFRAVAADIETGDAVVLGSGLLHEAIRASMTIPLVFQPVELQGRLLVDGGLANNLPVDVVRSMGADVVIAVDASARLEKRERLTSLLEIMSQSISLQVRRESERQAAAADLVITPDTADYSFADFPRMREIIQRGEEAARAALPQIREVLRAKAAAPPRREKRFRVTSLVVRGNRTVSEATLRFALSPVLFPRETTRDDLVAALAGVFRMGVFSDVRLDLEKEGEGMRAVLTVEENPVVNSLELSGNTILPIADFQDALSWQEGKTLNTTRLSEALDKLVRACREQGYLLTRVKRAGMKDDGRTLEIVMYEGRVDSFTIAGQEKTRLPLILREIETRPGRPLNFNTAAVDMQRLYALDYFESLGATMAESPEGGVDLVIRVKEKPTNKVRFGFRYDLGDRFTGLTDFIADNVGGNGIKVFLNTRYGNYADVALGYHSPVLYRTAFAHTLQAFYHERRYFLYEDQRRVSELIVTRTGAEFDFGYQLVRFGDTHLRYRFETDTIEEATGISPSHQVVRIGSLSLVSTIDTRDRGDFPQSGLLFIGAYDTARPEFGGTTGFTKASAYIEGIVPLSTRHVVVLESSAGLGGGDLPYQERFGLGGGSSLLGIPLLGYQRREFTGTEELGFAAAYRWRVRDYQLKAVKAFYLNLSAQAANVWDDKRDLTPADLRHGGSVGVHADTLIGPVRFDFGVGEQRRYTLYFSAGFDF
jgi:NTE family protein